MLTIKSAADMSSERKGLELWPSTAIPRSLQHGDGSIGNLAERDESRAGRLNHVRRGVPRDRLRHLAATGIANT